MAKNNNLTDFLTGVADAIRTKKGVTELINPQDFESEILSIETGGGGTSAVLGELNVSSNGTYEAGGKMTLVPGGIYQFKEQLPVETLAELYTAAQGNNGVIFSVLYQEIPLTQLVIHKTDDVYILESSSLAGMVENIYSTGTTTFTYTSIMDGGDITVELTSGWNTYIQNTKCEPPAQSTIRLPQDISGIPSNIINLVDLQFDTNNCVEAVLDASTTITIQKFGQFFKVTSNLNPAKRLTMVSMGGYDEFNIPEGEIGLEIGGMPAAFRNAAVSSELQADIEGIKYLKNYMQNVVMMYVEDASKIQITSGTAENGCWYLNQYMVMDPNVSWVFAYGKDPVDGYNKVTVNVPSQAKLQSKTATINGVYSPDEGFDGLSQVTVDFALQNKTITANGTYTCDEGYGGLGQINVSTVPNLQDKTVTANGAYRADASYDGLNKVTVSVTPKLQIKTITANGKYTAGAGYDGLKQVTVDVRPKLQSKTFTANGTYTCDDGFDGLRQVTVKVESRTLFDNNKLAVHTVVGADDLSLDPNKATIEELIVNEGATSVSKGTGYTNLKRVFLPGTLESIGNKAFYNCSGLTSITIPDSVTSIGGSAFQNCSGLTSITIPDNVISIEQDAFYNCSGLTSITIPDSVTSIGVRAFAKCDLDSISVSQGNTVYHSQGNCLIETDSKTLISGTNNSIIPDDNSVTSIKEYAFRGCNKLTSITIPDSVTNIKDYAFYECSKLANATIGKGVTSIGQGAFSYCSEMTSINISDSVTSIGWDAFERCYNLTRVDISDLSAWCKIQFSNSSANPLSYANNLYLNNELVTDLVIPNGVTSIGAEAFRGCSGLTSITIPDSVTSIGKSAFINCSKPMGLQTGVYISNLSAWCKIQFNTYYSNPLNYAQKLYLNNELVTNLVIPDDVTSIENNAFYNCSSLTSVTIPDSVTNIGSDTFAECRGLTSATIGNNVTNIGESAFYNCSMLTSIAIPYGVTSIESQTFYKCTNLINVNIPNSVTDIKLGAFEHCSKLANITIPNSVISIESTAFFCCNGLTSVTIPDSVTSIGSQAFSGCSGLTSAAIGNSVTNIGNYAFKECSGLTSVTIMSTTPPTLGTDVFTNTALTQIIVPAGCGEAYKTAENWSTYADYIIEEGMHRVTLGENVTCSVGGTSYSNQTFDVADQTVIHFEVGQASEGGVVSSTPDGIFLNGTLVSSDSEPATYDLTVTGNVSVTYSTGDVVGDITYNNCYKIVMN